MATKKSNKSCGHAHECEKCIREELTKAEAKVRELKAKLPQTIINICNHGCHGNCYHWNHTLPYYAWTGPGNGIVNAIGGSITATGYMQNINAQTAQTKLNGSNQLSTTQ